MTVRRRRWLPVLSALVLAGVVGPPAPALAESTVDCPAAVDEQAFASTARLRQLNATVAGFGLRTTGSAAHERVIDWIEHEVDRLPEITTRSVPASLLKWQPHGGDLESAGQLKVGPWQVPVAGAVPYSLPTAGSRGGLIYLPPGERITPANARGRIVVRDFPWLPIPYDPILNAAHHATPDLQALRGTVYDRGHPAESLLNRDLVDAGLAEAAGVVIAFDLPREQVRGYYEPHTGTHYRVPAVFVGSEEARLLRWASGLPADVAVHARREPGTTRSLIATLPGRSAERIVLDANTDGNTWVQENGNAALLAIADYLSRLPVRCRPRTVEFVFATGHLHRPIEGSEFRARELDRDYDAGTVAFALAVEHLGTRELLPVPRWGGRELRFSGKSEFTGWYAGSPVLVSAAINAIRARGLDRTAVLPGYDPPVPGRVPPQCSFGGIGSHFHGHLIPTMATISGPWSLWAPSFGASAIDFSRMRLQSLALADTVLALGDVPREQIAGPYLAQRQARAHGAPTCAGELPPEHAPAP
ncbi:hypothetical protein EV193_11742 [Herbihabitans rhizosphaerae]|uniref:Peptidase M28-like protein n=1 Tax=Herbihabitans rhizosphaerae TaxID=1872711 RepID=A0A4Q7KCF8_9PSEU|nr:hypothetical protein [Herbihabitans rhizosphaerae]RZS30346.1 hypothetical protein EV193_11742 [Herbihabitans rhizosphaerae]